MSGGWVSWCGRALSGAIAALLAVPAHAHTGRCQPTVVGTAAVHTVLDGRTLRLSDGREVRLIGLEVPDEPVAQRAAKAALAGLVDGREVTLARLEEQADRYGRLPALVYLSPAAQTSVQATLIAQGHARVAGRVGDRACSLLLLAPEQAARAAELGLWADPRYVIRAAEHTDQILAGRGTFTVVEGRVLSVRESGGTIYVNFGRRWSEDFTVTVLKRNERTFAAAGLPLQDLARRHVRIRGIVEERGGPWIEAMRPEQIEIAERN